MQEARKSPEMPGNARKSPEKIERKVTLRDTGDRLGLDTLSGADWFPAPIGFPPKDVRCIVINFMGNFIGVDWLRRSDRFRPNDPYHMAIIVAAVCHPTHVLEAALAGAHIATMGYDVMVQPDDHPPDR